MAEEILLVEDIEAHAKKAKEIIEEGGKYVVHIAKSGEEALEEIRRSIPALIVLDVELPGKFDGFQLLSHQSKMLVLDKGLKPLVGARFLLADFRTLA